MKSNDAEYLVQIINGNRFFQGKKLTNSQMVWKCTIDGCETPAKPQRRGQYENKNKCNSCSNKEKSKNPEILAKRGKAISKAISNLGDKWSEVAIKNMFNIETKEKISSSMKEFIKENKQKAIKIRKETALKNNKMTGFGTSEFSKNVWNSYSKDQKIEIGKKISNSLYSEGEVEHIQLAKERFPQFKVIQYGHPDSIYECSEGHLFAMRGSNFLKRGSCTECAPKSKIELDMYNWFLTISPNAKRNKRVLFLDDTKNGNKALEIDILDEEKRFGIEVHGLYVHQESIVGEKHKIKAELANKHNINLLQFFEDEILTQKPLIESMVKSKYGIFENVYYARKCEIKEIDFKTERAFLLQNHLQGDCKSFYKLGLFNEDKLISVLTFRRYSEKSIEIARFCTLLNTQVVGGFAKLLKYAENYLKNKGFTEIVTFSNRRYSNGDIYFKNGFSFVKNTVSDFYWVKNGTRYDRHISWGKTNEEMLNDKYYSILGAGHTLWSKPL